MQRSTFSVRLENGNACSRYSLRLRLCMVQWSGIT